MYYIHAYFSVTVTNGYAYNINMHFFFILAVFCKPYVCLFYNAECNAECYVKSQPEKAI